MDDISVYDTIAYRVTDEFVSHVYGDEFELDDESFMNIFRVFRKIGGTWEGVVRGNPKDVNILKDTIDSFYEVREAAKKYGLIENDDG